MRSVVRNVGVGLAYVVLSPLWLTRRGRRLYALLTRHFFAGLNRIAPANRNALIAEVVSRAMLGESPESLGELVGRVTGDRVPAWEWAARAYQLAGAYDLALRADRMSMQLIHEEQLESGLLSPSRERTLARTYRRFLLTCVLSNRIEDAREALREALDRFRNARNEHDRTQGSPGDVLRKWWFTPDQVRFLVGDEGEVPR
jgi:hypothetical protein